MRGYSAPLRYRYRRVMQLSQVKASRMGLLIGSLSGNFFCASGSAS